MKSMGIRSIIIKKFILSTIDSKHSYVPSDNLLDRNLIASRPGDKSISDITYVRIKQGWLYLKVVMDLFDRRIIGWSMSDLLAAKATVSGTLNIVLRSRPSNLNRLIFQCV